VLFHLAFWVNPDRNLEFHGDIVACGPGLLALADTTRALFDGYRGSVIFLLP
jgi:hypothetical protein